MRYIVIIGLALFTGLIMRRKKEYRGRVLAAFGIVMILMSVLYNVRLMDKVLPSFRPFNQAFYQTQYLDKGEYPDSLLMPLFKGKKVYVKDDIYYISEAENINKSFLYAYYHARNMHWFLECADAVVEKSENMKDAFADEHIINNDFEELGNTNDMFRYCFMYNDIPDEPGNYFTYYWYYYEYLDQIKAYICGVKDKNGQTVFDADELAVFWNTVDGVEEEDIYIMTKAYYDDRFGDREVADDK